MISAVNLFYIIFILSVNKNAVLSKINCFKKQFLQSIRTQWVVCWRFKIFSDSGFKASIPVSFLSAGITKNKIKACCYIQDCFITHLCFSEEMVLHSRVARAAGIKLADRQVERLQKAAEKAEQAQAKIEKRRKEWSQL